MRATAVSRCPLMVWWDGFIERGCVGTDTLVLDGNDPLEVYGELT